MTKEDAKAGTGQMRRLHEAIIRSGALGKIKSEGRLVLAIALCWANYRSCQFKMSARGAAKVAGVMPTSIRRGIKQLADAGIIEAGPLTASNRRFYRFLAPPNGEGHEPCAPPDTSRVPSAHERCPGRTPVVSKARTNGAPYSSIVLKGSVRNPGGRTVPDGPAVSIEEGSRQAAKLRAEGAA